MTHSITVPWGRSCLSLPLPDRWQVLGELKPLTNPYPVDPAVACRKALEKPIGATRIASRNLKKQRVVLVVDDHSRPTPVGEFIGPILEELAAAGVEDDRMDVLIATGVHRPSRPEEVERKLGKEIATRLRWRCHDAYNPDDLIDLGTTSRGTPVQLNRLLVESDLIICVGAVEPHLLLGFGGGLKMLVPGCASAKTIGCNHLLAVDPEHFDLVGVRGDRSPMRLDLEEAAQLVGREIFIVNAAMDELARPSCFFCGDPIQAHRAAEAFLEDHVALKITQQADVVITSSFPMNSDLRQAVKCMGNTLEACKPGGVVIACVRCENGLGEMPLPPKTMPYTAMRFLLKVLGKKRILPLVKRMKKGRPAEELFVAHFGLQMLRRNHLAILHDPRELPMGIGRKIGMAQSFTEGEAVLQWTAGKVPRDATVWVVPFGGSTYVPQGTSCLGLASPLPEELTCER